MCCMSQTASGDASESSDGAAAAAPATQQQQQDALRIYERLLQSARAAGDARAQAHHLCNLVLAAAGAVQSADQSLLLANLHHAAPLHAPQVDLFAAYAMLCCMRVECADGCLCTRVCPVCAWKNIFLDVVPQ